MSHIWYYPVILYCAVLNTNFSLAYVLELLCTLDFIYVVAFQLETVELDRQTIETLLGWRRRLVVCACGN